MDRSEITAKLKDIVKPYVNSAEALNNLSEKTDFVRDLQVNSANLVDIILDIEEKFGIVIDNESMEKMLNIRATLEIIESKLTTQ